VTTETTRPEQPQVPTEFKRIPENASADQREFAIVEMAQAYASIAAANMAELPALRTAIAELRAEMASHRLEVRRVESLAEEVRSKVVVLEVDIRRVTGRVDMLQLQAADKTSKAMVARDPTLEALPPMRPKLDSTHDDAEHASQEVARRYEAEVKNPSTPPPGVEKVKQFTQDVMEIALAKVKAKMLDDRLLAERNAARQLAKFKWASLTLAVATALTTTAYLVQHFAR